MTLPAGRPPGDVPRRTPPDERSRTVPTDPAEHRDRVIREIAALTVRARRQTDRMGRLSGDAATDYLCDVEHALASLVALGAVPGAPPAPAAAVEDGTVVRGTVL